MAKPHAPERIVRRSKELIERWREGTVRAKRTHRSGYLIIRVTPQWRLLSRNEGRNWTLLSHADYDNQI